MRRFPTFINRTESGSGQNTLLQRGFGSILGSFSRTCSIGGSAFGFVLDSQCPLIPLSQRNLEPNSLSLGSERQCFRKIANPETGLSLFEMRQMVKALLRNNDVQRIQMLARSSPQMFSELRSLEDNPVVRYNFLGLALKDAREDVAEVLVRELPELLDSLCYAGYDPVSLAICEGRGVFLIETLKRHPHLRNKKGYGDFTPLEFAILQPNPKIALLLIQEFPELIASEGLLTSPILNFAIENHNAKIVVALAKRFPKLLSQRDEQGRTLLGRVISSSNVPVVKGLLATFPELFGEPCSKHGLLPFDVVGFTGKKMVSAAILEAFPDAVGLEKFKNRPGTNLKRIDNYLLYLITKDFSYISHSMEIDFKIEIQEYKRILGFKSIIEIFMPWNEYRNILISLLFLNPAIVRYLLRRAIAISNVKRPVYPIKAEGHIYNMLFLMGQEFRSRSERMGFQNHTAHSMKAKGQVRHADFVEQQIRDLRQSGLIKEDVVVDRVDTLNLTNLPDVIEKKIAEYSDRVTYHVVPISAEVHVYVTVVVTDSQNPGRPLVLHINSWESNSYFINETKAVREKFPFATVLDCSIDVQKADDSCYAYHLLFLEAMAKALSEDTFRKVLLEGLRKPGFRESLLDAMGAGPQSRVQEAVGKKLMAIFPDIYEERGTKYVKRGDYNREALPKAILEKRWEIGFSEILMQMRKALDWAETESPERHGVLKANLRM